MEQLLFKLHKLGVKLGVDGDKLAVNAPIGSMTPELRSELAKHKEKLLAMLRQSSLKEGFSDVLAAAMEVREWEQSPDGARERWAELGAGRAFGDMVLDWCEAIRANEPPGFQLRYLEAWYDGRLQAMAVLHVLKLSQFDMSLFKEIKSIGYIFEELERLSTQPRAFDIAYLEIPFTGRSSILFTDEALARGQATAALRAILEAVRRRGGYDILLLKSVDGTVGEDAYADLGEEWLYIPFLPEVRLELPSGGFSDYLRSLSVKDRAALSRNRRIFAAAGGHVEMSEDFRLHAEVMGRLYEATCERHHAPGEVHIPISVDGRFFAALSCVPSGRKRVYLAWVKGQIVGFGLTVQTGGELFYTHCGLDYERAEPCRAYFNLYYAMIEDAFARDIRVLNLGPVAYEIKRRLGGQPQIARYHLATEKSMKPMVNHTARSASGAHPTTKQDMVAAGLVKRQQ